MSFIEVDGLRIRYQRGGSGSPVVILHGWGCKIETMQPVYEALASDFDVTILDLPGHGESAVPASAWGAAEYSSFLLRFFSALNLVRPSLVCHSVGGRFGIWLAANEPQHVANLVLADSAGIKPPRPLKYYLRVTLAKVGKAAARYLGSTGERLRAKIYSSIASADYQRAGEMRATLVKLVNEDLRQLLPKISTRTLLIWGAKDNDTPLASARMMQELIPN